LNISIANSCDRHKAEVNQLELDGPILTKQVPERLLAKYIIEPIENGCEPKDRTTKEKREAQ
jgi:hypothetical protein